MNIYEKPRYRWNGEQGKYIIMSNEVAKTSEAGVPAWLREKSTGAPIGNLGAEDIKPPQIKLLQATSPETAEQANAKAGEFWLSGMNIPLGPEIVGTPIILSRTYVIWNPTKSADSKVPLAVASDAVHWDIPNQVLDVRFPNNPTPYHWETKRTVAESGLDKFGSSRPEDPRSPPAASMTFQILWAFRLPSNQRPHLGVVTMSRSGLKPARELFAMAEGIRLSEGVDHYFQRYRMQAIRVQARPGEYFFSYKFFASGLVADEAEADSYKALYEKFRKAGFNSDLTPDDGPPPGGAPVKTYAAKEDIDEIPF